MDEHHYWQQRLANVYEEGRHQEEYHTARMQAFAHSALHSSAPEGHKCSDCSIDKEPCPTCYKTWWTKRHPNVTQLGGG
jgi:hypothetical protein